MDSLTMYLNLKEALNPEKKSLIEEVVHVCSSNQQSKKGCKEAKVLIFRIIQEIIDGGTENSTFVMAVNNGYYSEENKEIREVDAWLLLNATIKLLSTDNYSVEEDKNFCENFLNLSKKSIFENFEQEIMQMINSLNDFYKSLVPLKRYVKFKEKLQNKSDLETDDESKNILECQECERTNYNEMRKKMQDKLNKFIKRLDAKRYEFSNYDFRDFDMSQLNSESFVYADPPYLITCATYNEQGGWNEQDEKDLLQFLDKLHSNNIKFALSNVLRSKGKENSILINWINKNIDKYRVINLNYDYNNSNYQVKDKDSVTEEVLIINY